MANPVQIITTPNQPDPIPGNHDGLKTLQTPMAPQKTISTALFQSKYHVTTLHCMMVRLTTAQINALTHVGRQCYDPRQAHKKRLTTGLRNAAIVVTIPCSDVLVMTQLTATATRPWSQTRPWARVDKFTVPAADKAASESISHPN